MFAMRRRCNTPHCVPSTRPAAAAANVSAVLYGLAILARYYVVFSSRPKPRPSVEGPGSSVCCAGQDRLLPSPLLKMRDNRAAPHARGCSARPEWLPDCPSPLATCM